MKFNRIRPNSNHGRILLWVEKRGPGDYSITDIAEAMGLSFRRTRLAIIFVCCTISATKLKFKYNILISGKTNAAVAHFAANLKQQTLRSDKIKTIYGNKIIADTEQDKIACVSNPMSEPNDFDFRLCTYVEGWVRIDTKLDASFYRIWCHPDKCQIVSYYDGQITIIRCGDDETFVAEMRRTAELNRERGCWIGIEAHEDQRHRFVRLGLADLLH
jgi:hypothetical protein